MCLIALSLSLILFSLYSIKLDFIFPTGFKIWSLKKFDLKNNNISKTDPRWDKLKDLI